MRILSLIIGFETLVMGILTVVIGTLTLVMGIQIIMMSKQTPDRQTLILGICLLTMVTGLLFR